MKSEIWNLVTYIMLWTLRGTYFSIFRFNNSLKLEQFKLYESLMSHSRNELLIHESFLRPLLRLLSSCVDQCFSVEAEKRLVALLNLLCVSFMQQSELIELFFPSLQEPSQNRYFYYYFWNLIMLHAVWHAFQTCLPIARLVENQKLDIVNYLRIKRKKKNIRNIGEFRDLIMVFSLLY